MANLGSLSKGKTSEHKKKSSRENGKLGGRPISSGRHPAGRPHVLLDGEDPGRPATAVPCQNRARPSKHSIHPVNFARHAPDLPEDLGKRLLGSLTSPVKVILGGIEDPVMSGRLVDERKGRKSGPFHVKEDGKSPLFLG